MTVGRETAGFVLPFAAGVFASAFIPALSQVPPTAALLTTCLCAITLIHPAHKKFNAGTVLSIILLMACSCGIFVGTSGHIMSISSIEGNWFVSSYASDFANQLKHQISNIPFETEESHKILTALITGDRSGLSDQTIDAFRNSGASHILALSGLHLGIIYGILQSILNVAGNQLPYKISKSIIIIAICGFYTIATGSGASIVRAFLFILIGEILRITGRSRSTGSILMTALFIQLVFSPESIKSVGFQLSYAAMAGIAYIYPALKTLWTEDYSCKASRPFRWIWNSAAMSIACQLTTGPLAYFYFGTFPQYFLLTNLIALPLVGIIIPLGLITIVLESIGINSYIMAQVTESLIQTMIDSLQIISSL